jgi:hypothetical protein
MDHKVLQKKLRRTTDSYIEIQQIHTKEHQIHTNRYSSSHSIKRNPRYVWKHPCFHTRNPAGSYKDPRCIQQKETKKAIKSSRSSCYRPRSGRSRPASLWWSSMLAHCHGGAQRRRPMGGARGRRVELEANGWNSRPSVGRARSCRWRAGRLYRGGGRGSGSCGIGVEQVEWITLGFHRPRDSFYTVLIWDCGLNSERYRDFSAKSM